MAQRRLRRLTKGGSDVCDFAAADRGCCVAVARAEIAQHCRDLPIAHGAPVRLRVERQLGYKSVKFVQRIVVTDVFDDLGKIGALQNGWSWYVGI